MTQHILALDVGTQSVRAAVTTPRGRVLGVAQTPHAVETPRIGWAQQKPDAWWEMICAATNRVLAQTGISPKTLAAISCCGQMHAPVGLDDAGHVTLPSVQLWCDKRCETQCERVYQSGRAQELAAISANLPNPAWMGFKVAWVMENEPEAYARTRLFLVPKDFINFRLTGVARTDPSEASCSYLWDADKDAYSPILADALGMDLRKFAKAVPSHAVIGQVTDAAARATGIPSGTPVVAGGGDFPVSLLGFGLVGAGTCVDVSGTSAVLGAHSVRPVRHPSIQNLRHVIPGWVPFALVDCGGLSMKWCRDLISSAAGRDITYDALVALASKAPPGSDGLIFYPHMLGERRRENTKSRGAFVGLGLQHDATHMARAVMEGVAYALAGYAESFRAQEITMDRLRIVGGGARNKLWNQIKADVLRLPVELPGEVEAGLRGAALLGAAGVGLIDNLEKSAVNGVRAEHVVQPIPENSERYAEPLREYARVYERLLGFWQ